MGMISIEGKEFIGDVEFITDVDNSVDRSPGSTRSFVTDMGVNPLLIRIRGVCSPNTDSFSDVRKAIMTEGELDLILDSGWKYKVYRETFRPRRPAGVKATGLNGSANYFDVTFVCEYPYQFSSTANTRSHAVTANNETWTADDSGNAISTSGEVDAVPDIQVTGGATYVETEQASSDSLYAMNAGAAAVTISQTSTNSQNPVSSTELLGQWVRCRKAGMAIIDSFQANVKVFRSAGDVTCTVYDRIGGTALSSKAITISGTGDNTWTFTTPVAATASHIDCVDTASDTDMIYFELTAAGSTDMDFATDVSSGEGAYADGRINNDGIYTSNKDMYFVVTGHSCKEIRQTFTVDETYKISSVKLNLCMYNYAGSNPVTATIKDGATTLGSGTSVLAGSTFADVTFILDEDADSHDLELSSGTTYTLSITPPSDSVNATSVLIKTNTTTAYADGAVTLVEDGGTTRAQTHDLYFTLYLNNSNEDVQIYNTSDTTIKCSVANRILNGAIHRINVDGTGTIDFDDDFTSDKYKYTNEGMLSVTYDDPNNKITIADDGYIYWKIDSKYPVNGIPTVLAQIDITSGTPTIKISSDATTWYDIDTAIVDDVDTSYELDTAASLNLKGKTSFYFRFDCVKAGAATCSVKSFKLDVAIVPIDAENPVITVGGSASTIRCDQDSASGMACTVALIFEDRMWPG